MADSKALMLVVQLAEMMADYSVEELAENSAGSMVVCWAVSRDGWMVG